MNEEKKGIFERGSREGKAIDELKRRLKDLMGGKDRMRLDSDFYLYQWIKANKFNLNRAEVAIRDSFKWRVDNRLSTQVDDFPEDLLTEFPADETTISKTGMPIVTLFAAAWDVRSAIARKDEARVVRYVNLRTITHEHMWVDHNESLMKANTRPLTVMENPENINLIVSATDMSLKQVTTPKAVECFIQFVKNIATKFPKMVGDIIFINFTKLYYIALNVVKPFLTFARMQVFDCNEDRWKKALFEITTPDQLPAEFGGTRGPLNLKPAENSDKKQGKQNDNAKTKRTPPILITTLAEA